MMKIAVRTRSRLLLPTAVTASITSCRATGDMVPCISLWLRASTSGPGVGARLSRDVSKAGEMTIVELSAPTGFGSPPAWICPLRKLFRKFSR